ncbi:MAG: hypothetical protein KA807_14125 [Prolixibacteraceae bacterium]|nr:hypothetical protein [Prolixibacteraceae bacterium]
MNQKLPEHTGRIIKLDKIRGFGFVCSEDDQNNYYFKVSALHGEFHMNDAVSFLVNTKNDKTFASAIRKVYQNSVGIKFIPRIVGTHIHEGTEPLLKIVFEQILDLNSAFLEKEFTFPSIIGKTTCVETSDDDTVFYAIRKDRKGHSRFVLNREPEDTQSLTVVLKRASDHYIIITCFLGKLAQPEPYDPKATQDSIDFWNRHALIFENETIIPYTETNICPWVLNQPAHCKFPAKDFSGNIERTVFLLC